MAAPSIDASSTSPTSSPTLRIALAGDLVVATRQTLKMRVVDAIAGGTTTVILDLTDCSYIDSSGLGVLVSIAKKLRDVGGTLVLERPNDDLRTLLELSHIDTILTVAPR